MMFVKIKIVTYVSDVSYSKLIIYPLKTFIIMERINLMTYGVIGFICALIFGVTLNVGWEVIFVNLFIVFATEIIIFILLLVILVYLFLSPE